MKKFKKLVPRVKGRIEMFLNSEEGKILKEDIVKGAALLGIAGGILAAGESSALAQHNNYLHNSGGSGQHVSHGSHGSHGSHSSRGSHGSHG